MGTVATPLETQQTTAMAAAEDYALISILGEREEIIRSIPMVQFESDQLNNLDEIFALLLGDGSTHTEKTITQHDLYKLDTFGATLACQGKLLEAKCCFEKILSIDPNFLKSYQNLDNVKSQLVERWHFGMLNDSARNSKYKLAIQQAIQSGEQMRVLDIGTGTGLLAIYAAECGAQQVYACDQSTVMCRLAKTTFQRNGHGETIKLIPKHSTDLDPDTDLNGKVDLILTETMDCGVFGEGLLQTLIHAKQNLLKSTGRIIPGRVKMFVAGFQSRTIAIENNVVNSSSFTDTVYVRNYALSSNIEEPYDSCHVQHLKDFELITKTEEIMNVNLNNLEELCGLMNGKLKKDVRLEYTKGTGILDGFCVWFQMSLDANDLIVISTNPFAPKAPDATAGQPQQSCWECAIFRLNHRFANTQYLQTLNVTLSCANGVLHLDHYYNLYGKTYTDMSPEIITYLNDTEFINAIEYDVFAELKRRKRSTNVLDSVLDFLPFPTVGLALLKEKRLTKLFCSRDAQDFVQFIAASNCIAMASIVFINDPADILFVDDRFDVIVMPLVHRYGALISSQIANYSLLKSSKLTPNGFMVPEKIEIVSDLVQSEWLRNATRVIEPEIVDRLKIAELINEYGTTVQLDLTEDFAHQRVYGPYRTSIFQLNDLSYEIEHKLYLGATKAMATIHGILFHFNFTFTKSSIGVMSTRRKNSFVHLGCFVCKENDINYENEFVTLRFQQNNGVVKLSLK